jgi:hypothetical protein
MRSLSTNSPSLLQSNPYSGGDGTNSTAPNGTDGGTLTEAVSSGIDSIVSQFTSTLTDSIGGLLSDIIEFLVQTPYPVDDAESFIYFQPPESGLWAELYPLYQDVQLLVTGLFTLALGLTMLTAIWGDEVKKRKAMRKLIIHLPLAYWWWWFAGWFLKFNHEMSMFLLTLGSQDGNEAQAQFISNFDQLMSAALSAGIFALIIYVIGGLIIIVLAVTYLARYIGIHIYIVGGPILLLLAAFPIDPIAGWANSILQKFFPLVLMTQPVALLLAVGIEVMT